MVNISGGTVGRFVEAMDGSTISIAGGSFGSVFTASPGSTINLFGGEFRLDGVPIGGLDTVGDTLAFDLPVGSLLSGTLADGTPFGFSISDFNLLVQDRFASGTLTLHAAALPAVGPATITTPNDPVPLGIRTGQTLIVEDEGAVGDHFNAGWGSTVEVTGGQVGRNFEAVGATVNISGGQIGPEFDVYHGSTVNISGGTRDQVFVIWSGGTANISGGTESDALVAMAGSSLNIFGGEFRIDGVPVAGLETVGDTRALNVPAGSVFSGTLADGTPFAHLNFQNEDGEDYFADGTLTLHAAALPAVGPATIIVPVDPAPSGIRTGQTLIVEDGGAVGDNFNAGWGSTVVISGGQVGENFEAVATQVTISGGSVGDHFDAFGGTVVNITGGSVGDWFVAHAGSTVNISGGFSGRSFDATGDSTVNVSGGSVGFSSRARDDSTVNISGGFVGPAYLAFDNSVVNISGGTVGDWSEARDNSTVNISGGTVGDYFWASDQSMVNLIGTEFVLDGVDITDTLTLDVPFTVESRDVTLAGLLSDGSAFSFDLNSVLLIDEQDFFDLNATLTIMLTLPGADFNGDGIVDGDDFLIWQASFGQDAGGDADGDGDSDGNDYLIWQTEFGSASGSASAAVPEPSSIALLVCGLVAVASSRWLKVSWVSDPCRKLSRLGEPWYFLLVGLWLCLAATIGPAYGQFTTILNLPPDPNILDEASIGSDTQVNLFDGGMIGYEVDAGSPSGTSTNIEVNISGGTVGSSFEAFDGSVVNISGGTVGRYFEAFDGSIVNISGGSVGQDFEAHAGSIVNLSGGAVGRYFHASGGSTVNVSGGTVDSVVSFEDGSTVNIAGGTFAGRVIAWNASMVNISGGSFANRFEADAGSTVNLSGNQFRLDGVLVGGLDTVGDSVDIDLPSGSTLSGTFADGTPFAFNISDFPNLLEDQFANGTLALHAATLPAVGPSMITTPSDPIPRGIRAGQTLVVEDGGAVGDFFNAGYGSTVHIRGGQVGSYFTAVGATVNISGGQIGPVFDVYHGSTVNVSGGLLAGGLYVWRGGTADISGGTDGNGIVAVAGSTLNISGGEFRLGGVPITGLGTVGSTRAINVPMGVVLSGTLADGTPFAYMKGYQQNFFADGALTLQAAALPAVGPATITVPVDPAPQGIRAGQTLVVENGGVVGDNFNAAWGSAVVISGGQVGENFEAVGTQVTISGGSVGRNMRAFDGTVVDITGGSVGSNLEVYTDSIVNIFGGSVERIRPFSNSTVNVAGGSVGSWNMHDVSTVNITGGSTNALRAFDDSVVNISGGTVVYGFGVQDSSTINISGGSIGDGSDAFLGGTVNISGGSVGAFFWARSQSTVNISGGTVGNYFQAWDQSVVNLIGTQFLLDGVDITDSLTVDVPLPVDDRDVTLAGTLFDGSPFSFDLTSVLLWNEQDFFDPNAMLTIMLALPGADFNGDGIVDGDDFLIWQASFGQDAGGDADGDGDSDGNDFLIWQSQFNSGSGSASAAVPEPASMAMLLAMAAIGVLSRFVPNCT